MSNLDQNIFFLTGHFPLCNDKVHSRFKYLHCTSICPFKKSVLSENNKTLTDSITSINIRLSQYISKGYVIGYHIINNAKENL